MCNANPRQQAVLNNINAHSVHDIEKLLEKHNFELRCLIKYQITPDKLNLINSDVLKEKVHLENMSQIELKEAGMSESNINFIFGNVDSPIEVENETIDIDFVPPAPSGLSYLAQDLVDRVLQKRITVDTIQDALLNGEITENDLKEYCFLDDTMIERIRSYTPIQMDPIEFKKLPPLREDRTDFYFLGLAGAGKSCLVASLLCYWMRKGICNPEVANPRSVEYFRKLGGGLSRGILPKSTQAAFIDYIELTLNFKEIKKVWFKETEVSYEIPINLIDMPGEVIARVANGGKSEFNDHKNYFNNSNLKALFFVLDYSMDNEGKEAFEQSLSLQVVLNNLHDMGIFENTTGVYLIVSKSDMFNTSKENYKTYATDYINEYYMSFMTRLNDLEKKYDFAVEVLTYSIGDCTLGQLLVDYDMRTNQNLKIFPEELHARILNHTARYKKGLRGLFSN
jgi:hypothetical protein